MQYIDMHIKFCCCQCQRNIIINVNVVLAIDGVVSHWFTVVGFGVSLGTCIQFIGKSFSRGDSK